LSRLLEVLSQEAIAVDQADVLEHQARLKQLASRVKPEAPLVEFEQQLQVELHAYRETTEKKVTQLRKDLASTADAMQEYVTRFNGQDQTQEKMLTTDLDRLAALRKLSNVQQIHAGLDTVRVSIQSTLEQIKTQNQAIVAQLRDEIRTLHKRLENVSRREDQPGTLVNRAPFERRIRAKVASNDIFSLYLIRVTNWKDLTHSFDQEEALTLVTNISNRLAAVLGPDTFSGRWYDGYFAAIIGMDKRTAMERASELAQQLSGIYATGGAPVAIRSRVAVVDYIPGQDAEQTLRRVEQLIRAFES
jgi:GGDEF domain-containing protein